MSALLDEIQVKAAALSAEERAALALRLIESLDAGQSMQQREWESVWLAECEATSHVPRPRLSPGFGGRMLCEPASNRLFANEKI